MSGRKKAKITALKEEAHDLYLLIERQAKVLDGVADAVHGPAPERVMWSHHDLAERVTEVVAQRDALVEENASLREDIRALQTDLRYAQDDAAEADAALRAERGGW